MNYNIQISEFFLRSSSKVTYEGKKIIIQKGLVPGYFLFGPYSYLESGNYTLEYYITGLSKRMFLDYIVFQCPEADNAFTEIIEIAENKVILKSKLEFFSVSYKVQFILTCQKIIKHEITINKILIKKQKSEDFMSVLSNLKPYLTDIVSTTMSHCFNKKFNNTVLKKLELIDHKISNSGNRIPVLFITSCTGRFHNSIYKIFENSYFSPKIGLIPSRLPIIKEHSRNLFPKEITKDALKNIISYAEKQSDIFQSQGFNVEYCFEKNTGELIFNPSGADIVFVVDLIENDKYIDSLSSLLPDSLICILPYGYPWSKNIFVPNGLEPFLETHISDNNWIYFCNGKDMARELKKHVSQEALVLSCKFPRQDEFNTKTSDNNLYKIKNKFEYSVAWTPHHSIPNILTPPAKQFSTFLIYKDLLANLVNTYSNILWIFRPHPMLKINLQLGELEQYITELESNNDNFIYYPDNSYMNIFDISDGLITDISSTYFDYFPSLKPILLCRSTGQEAVELEYFFNAAYQTNNTEDFTNFVNSRIIDKLDPKYTIRKLASKQYYPNNNGYRTAAEFIYKTVTENIPSVYHSSLSPKRS